MITVLLKDVARRVRELPPSVTGDEVREALRALAESPMDWAAGDDNRVRRQLGEIEGGLKRLQRLKEGGIEAYADQPEIKAAIGSLVRRCAEIGLFFVPCGELENWVPSLMAGCSKRMNKIERAALAASKIRAADIKEGDIWAFAQLVFAFLRARQGV